MEFGKGDEFQGKDMIIRKNVGQPFLITSGEVLRLMRTGKAEITLPNEPCLYLEIDDYQDQKGDDE